MKKSSLICLLIGLLITTNTYATVDYLAVNHITKEYFWGDDDNRSGWIGWNYIPEGELDTAEERLINLGYRRTHNPYKIEIISALVIGSLLTVGLIKLKKIKAYNKK